MQNLLLFESDSQPCTVDNYLSFNFNDYNNLNLTTFHSITETKSYTPITGCVLEHVLTTTNLTNCEKLFYLLGDSPNNFLHKFNCKVSKIGREHTLVG